VPGHRWAAASVPAVTAVVVSNLEVRYGDTVAVADVSFTVSPGEVVAVLGPNGAGKTTTIEAVEGLRWPSAGSVRVFGHDPVRARDEVTGRWGVMPQHGGLPTGLHVREVVALFAALHPGVPTDVDGLVDLVGLGSLAGRPWRRLSGGEQQRLSLAAALVGRPELLLLDEPTAAMDPRGRREVGSLLRERADAGVAVVLATHLLDEVEAVCDRVVVIDRGRVVAAGSIAELTSATAVVTFRAEPGLPTGELAQALGTPVTEVDPGRYRVAAGATPDLLAGVTAWLAARDVTVSHLGPGDRLEDVFLRLTDETDR
jgi:ABC-2 type transport system ATP-binding protein